MIYGIVKELLPLARDAVKAIYNAIKAAKRGDEEEAAREIIEATRHIALRKRAEDYLKKGK